MFTTKNNLHFPKNQTIIGGFNIINGHPFIIKLHSFVSSDAESLYESAKMKLRQRKQQLCEKLVKIQKPFEFEYLLLDRLKADCKYYLGAGNRNPDNLWAHSPKKQIEKMIELYNMVPIKPVWLSMEDIYDYAMQMSCLDTLSEFA